MSDHNIVTLIGRLTADPQRKYTQGGMEIAEFSIANNYYVSTKNTTEVNYFNIVAFGKLAKIVSDNEEVTSKALNVLNGSCGFNQNGIYEPDNSYLNGETNLASAIDTLAETVAFLNGHNSLDSTQSIPSTKRLVIVTRSSNDVLTLASNNLPDGRELHIIVHNTGSGDITISMPTSGGFVNVVGDTLTVSAGGYGEINVISDGVNKYIRFA